MTIRTFLNSFVFLVAVLLVPIAKAQEKVNFITSYDTNYFFGAEGEVLVDQKVEITNKQKDIIPTSFSLIVKNITITDVEAKDAKEDLEVETSSNDYETIIKAIFDEQQIGLDKKNTINIRYRTKDLINKIGRIYNISIPPVTDFDSIEGFYVTLNVPESYGKKLFLSPQPLKEEVSGGTTKYYFDKGSLSSGISAAFGEYQVFNYNIKYHLKNTSVLTSTQTISLLPEIEKYQQVELDNIDPKPDSVTTDEDGNPIAHYRLSPKSEIHINMRGKIKVVPYQFQPSEGGMLNEIPANLISKYTSQQKYWETKNPIIQEIVKKLKNPESTVAQNAFAAYKEVTQKLKYNAQTDSEIVSRRGAVSALTQEGTLACMEYTDAFVAIVRGMGIPAREINGYAFSVSDEANPISQEIISGDLLHSWAEFYDPNLGWVQVDPTWGSTSGLDYFTKLDTNHIAFVTKGINSERPLPAGAYRFDDSEKQIDISPTETQTEIADIDTSSKNISITQGFGLNIFKLLQGKTAYKITNNTDRKIYSINNENISLSPFESKVVYTDREVKISYTDFTGKSYTSN